MRHFVVLVLLLALCGIAIPITEVSARPRKAAGRDRVADQNPKAVHVVTAAWAPADDNVTPYRKVLLAVSQKPDACKKPFSPSKLEGNTATTQLQRVFDVEAEKRAKDAVTGPKVAVPYTFEFAAGKQAQPATKMFRTVVKAEKGQAILTTGQKCLGPPVPKPCGGPRNPREVDFGEELLRQSELVRRSENEVMSSNLLEERARLGTVLQEPAAKEE